MKTSALRFLAFSLFALFCGSAAAFDTDAKLEELKALQAAMNQAQQDQNLPEAKRLAGEIKKLVAEFEAKRAESASVSESTPEPTPEPEPVVQQTAQEAPADKSPEPVADADQSAPYEKDFDRLVKLRDSEKVQALLPIQKRFDLAAQQLLRKAVQTGNLDAANKIKAFIETPHDLATLRQEAATPMDRELLRLVEQREKDTTIASAPAQKRFDLAAQQLLRKVTQSGNLEAANKLKEMIKEAEGSSGSATSVAAKTEPASTSHSLSSSFSKMKENPESDFETESDGKSAGIVKYIGKSEYVRVPAMIQGAPVRWIGRKAFADCITVKEIIFPETVLSIAGGAFWNSHHLRKIYLPSSIVEIDGNTFRGNSIEELNIPSSVKKLGGMLTSWCSVLEKINVDPANESYASVDGALYDKQITTLLNVPAGLKNRNLKLPSTVKIIAGGAIVGVNSMTIQIPKETEIQEGATFDCSKLKIIRY